MKVTLTWTDVGRSRQLQRLRGTTPGGRRGKPRAAGHHHVVHRHGLTTAPPTTTRSPAFQCWGEAPLRRNAPRAGGPRPRRPGLLQLRAQPDPSQLDSTGGAAATRLPRTTPDSEGQAPLRRDHHTSFTRHGPDDGTTYYYRVTAVNSVAKVESPKFSRRRSSTWR